MTASRIRERLRRARQDKRRAGLTDQDINNHPRAAKAFIIFGGDLDKIKAYPIAQPDRRQLRSMRAEGLRAAIQIELSKSKKPLLSFKALKQRAEEITRRLSQRVQRRGVM